MPRPSARDSSTETVRVLLVGTGTHTLADRLRALSPRVETVAVADAAEGEAHLGRVEVVIAGQRVRPAR